MEKYLIEVPHGEDKASCLMAVKIFLSSGSHFLANADWGCEDGEHKAWMVVETENKEEAWGILPSSMKPNAKIVKLTRFTRKDMEEAPYNYHI